MTDEIMRLMLQNHNGTGIDADVKCQFHDKCSTEHSTVVLGRHVCYIVGAVLLNEKKEVLLIQEAKPSCRGSWYLPAGRVESDETLVDAVKREVLEESGLIFQPSGLISIEENSSRWMRFIFAGDITGGSLKTTDEADAESLQAGWFYDPVSVHLRCRDILRVIQLAKTHYDEKSHSSMHRKFTVLPLLTAHKTMYIRAFIVCKNESHSINILQFKKKHLPISCIEPEWTIDASLKEILLICLTPSSYASWSSDVVGILLLQHNGDSKSFCDGICLTVLINLKCKTSNDSTTSLPSFNTDNFSWLNITEGEIYDCFNSVECQKNQCVPLIQLF